jgi:uncharacterized protein (TIGR02594 family)
MAMRWLGMAEVKGDVANPTIMAMLTLDNTWPENDETPWCSAFVNYVCWLLYLPRSESLRARSWLNVGQTISLPEAEAGWDIVILARGSGPQPGPEVIDAPGHVGFFGGIEGENIKVLGGNQGNAVSVSEYPISRLLGVRRI